MLRKIFVLLLFSVGYYLLCLAIHARFNFFYSYERWGIAVLLISGIIGIWASHFIFPEKKFPGAGIPLLTAVRIIPALIYFMLPYFMQIYVGQYFPVFFIISYFIFMAFEIYLILSKLRPEIK